MKVLLFEDVECLGYYGDIVNVKEGYARNYLLPQGLAAVPSESKIKAMAEEKARRSEQRNLVRRQLEKLAETVNGTVVEIIANANDLGHLFGSVTERDVAEQLRQKGFEIKDAMVRLGGGHIKELGTHDVNLRIAQDLKAGVQVRIVSEQEQQQQQEQQQEQEQQEQTVESVEENKQES
jgi:large subunit ribosomal protein L9